MALRRKTRKPDRPDVTSDFPGVPPSGQIRAPTLLANSSTWRNQFIFWQRDRWICFGCLVPYKANGRDTQFGFFVHVTVANLHLHHLAVPGDWTRIENSELEIHIS